jgi:hypothetical protein
MPVDVRVKQSKKDCELLDPEDEGSTIVRNTENTKRHGVTSGKT